MFEPDFPDAGALTGSTRKPAARTSARATSSASAKGTSRTPAKAAAEKSGANTGSGLSEGPGGKTGSADLGDSPGDNGIQADPVFEAIMRAILLRRLRPGTKLGEDIIAQMFDTNRMHVRKVFAHLAYRGIVKLQPNRGAFVSRPSIRDAHEVFESRRAIERACVERLIEVLTPDALAQLRAHNQMEQQADRADRLAFIAMSGEFHMLIARLGESRILHKFMEELTAHTALIIAEYEHPGSLDCSPDCHPQLVEMIAARDREGAVALMDQHLQQMWARLDLGNRNTEADGIAQALYHGMKANCCPPATGG